MRSETDFARVLEVAVEAQSKGKSVGATALLIAPLCTSDVEALLVSRAAQVHARWRARQKRPRVRWFSG